MIVYNVLEEIRIVLYLLTLGIFIPTNYDLLKIIESKKRTLMIITKSLGSLLILILCYLFIYKLKEGYVPQYGILIVLLGIVVYYVLLRKKFLIKINKIKTNIERMLKKMKWIFKPFRIFKTTISQIKQKSKNLYIKILYKRKKM